MEREELAKRYLDRIKRCFLIIKIFVACTLAAVIALAVFAGVASGTGLRENNPDGFALGVVIAGGIALAFAIAPIVCLIIAKISLVKLQKLDMREADKK